MRADFTHLDAYQNYFRDMVLKLFLDNLPGDTNCGPATYNPAGPSRVISHFSSQQTHFGTKTTSYLFCQSSSKKRGEPHHVELG
jgi:hypothetical protein